MRRVRLRGTYAEIGEKYGKALAKHDFKPREAGDSQRRFTALCEKEVRRCFSEVLDEIQGVAMGASCSYEDLASLILGAGIPVQCSGFAVNGAHTRDKKPLMGRNYDWLYKFRKFIETYRIAPKGAYASIGNSDIMIGREDGVNEKGVAITSGSIACKDVSPGLSFVIFMRAVLDKCASVREAIELGTKVKHARGAYFLLVDESGDMAVLEVSPSRVAVREPENGMIFATNYFAHPEMQSLEEVANRPPDATTRYTRLKELVSQASPHITVGRTERILADHRGFICSHIEKVKLGTLWSFVTQPSEKNAFVAPGHPCDTDFRELRL